MNSLYQQLNKTSLPNNSIKQMMNLLKNSNNPQALLQMMINQNPQLQQVMNLINQNGGDAKQTFYALAKQKGVNPDDILNMLK